MPIATPTLMPALFAGHGSPINVLDPANPFNRGLATVAQSLPRPRAILMVSAHWVSAGVQLTGSAQPPLMYDFHGFPQALYQVPYPARGEPALAQQVQQLLAPEPTALHPSRGFDHGMWAVLKYLYPQADVPVVQLSLHGQRDFVWHFALAQRLRPLREQGVLIVGSGNIVHNLALLNRTLIQHPGAGYDWAAAFHMQVRQAIEQGDMQTLQRIERLGPIAQLAVPTPEHYLPLLYVMALRDAHEPVRLFNDALVGGSLDMTSVLVGHVETAPAS